MVADTLLSALVAEIKASVSSPDCKEPFGKVTEVGTYSRRLGGHTQLACTTGQILASSGRVNRGEAQEEQHRTH